MIKIKPDPNCKHCHGTGEVYDRVDTPFGNSTCLMPSLCGCVEEQIPEGEEDAEVIIDIEED